MPTKAKAKQVKAWAVVTPSGYMPPNYCEPTRFECIRQWCVPNRDWASYYKRGYRCIKVVISPARKGGVKK